MATTQNFDGKILIIPGVYSNIKSGIKNPPQTLAYGDLLIIDTGSGAGFGGGAGINGEISQNSDSIYEFDNIEDFRDFVEKGVWWLMAEPLFRPLVENGLPSDGVSKITYIKAATTTAASMLFDPVGGDASNSTGGGGSISIQVRSEGLVGNGLLGALSGTELSRGYAFKMIQGIRNTGKFILQFYRGTYKGLDQNSLPYDGITEEKSKPELLVQSKEFRHLSDLVDWMKTSSSFNKYFRYDEAGSSFTSPADEVDEADLVTFTNYTLASGGTESYSSGDLADVLLVIKNMATDFIFADKWGVNAFHANNQSIFNWIKNESKFKPQLYIASGSSQSEFASSKLDAADYDSQYVTIVHGGAKKASKQIGTGFRVYDSFLKAAYFLGREAGIPPQVPLTFKAIGIEGETHLLNETEKIQALDAGVLVSHNDQGRFECLKGVNTLQDNDQLLLSDGTTHSKQLFRIAHQINKEIIITAKSDLLNNPLGVNRNSLSTQDVINWTKNFLQRKLASPTSDNLILSFQDVTASREGDSYRINYAFTANTEISFLFFTGIMLDVN